LLWLGGGGELDNWGGGRSEVLGKNSGRRKKEGKE